jgi:tRNA(fMet)-specific endonuclease VapC
VFLLDTNVCVDFLAGNRRVSEHLVALEQAEVYLSAITIGEMAYGAMRSSRPAEEILRLQRLMADASVLPVDVRVSLEYGSLKSQLAASGKLLEDNYLFIASTAISHGLILVTHDKGFSRIPNLRIEDWM